MITGIMRWLVDGYNVIRCDPGLAAHERESLEAGRDALCRLLADAARSSGDQFTVVFDGARGGGTALGSRGIRVVFSRAQERADDVLARLASAGVAVVSTDREVQKVATRAGAIAITADDFLARVLAPPSPEKDEDDVLQGPKRGNPRKLSKKARAAERALKRIGRSTKRFP